jgi:hypothetical protein
MDTLLSDDGPCLSPAVQATDMWGRTASAKFAVKRQNSIATRKL